MNPTTPEWLKDNPDFNLQETLSAVKTHADVSGSNKITNASFYGEIGKEPSPSFTAPTISKINEQRKVFVKKGKPDYRLYPIYEQLVGMLAGCKPTLDELFYYGEKGTSQETVLLYSPTAIHFSDVSEEHKKLIDSIYDMYVEVKDQPNQCRNDWVREKVVQTRYTNKGREYASRLEEIGNTIFSLSALVADFQSQLYQVLANSGEFNEK